MNQINKTIKTYSPQPKLCRHRLEKNTNFLAIRVLILKPNLPLNTHLRWKTNLKGDFSLVLICTHTHPLLTYYNPFINYNFFDNKTASIW